MNDFAVIVPVKSSGSKSRLSPVLSPRERRELAVALFKGVMGSLAGAGLADACFVVTPDREVLRLAGELGAKAVAESSDSGVNSAVLSGIAAAPEAKDFLVLPSDLPMLLPRDIRHLLKLKARGLSVVLSPSAAFDGTNALLFPRAPPFPLSFDRNSFWNHLRGAAGLGLSAGVSTRPGITFDVDSPADLRQLGLSKVKTEASALARRALR